MDFSIEQMTEYHLGEAILLWNKTEGLGIGPSDSIENLSKHIQLNPDLNFVAVSGNNLIGTVLGGFDGRRGYIYHLAIDKNFRNNKIGKALMDTCFNKMKEKKIEKCHIMVLKDNITAHSFYKKNGCIQRNDIVLFTKNLL